MSRMKNNDDILTGSKDLKKMPFSVPEGYFEGFDAVMRRRIRQEEKSGQGQTGKTRGAIRLVPIISAAAAAIAIFVAIGLMFKSSSTAVNPEDSLQDSDIIFYYSELMPATVPESIYHSYDLTDAELSDDDIVNYLIYSGVDVDLLMNE